MKKTASLLLAGALTLGLSACGEKPLIRNIQSQPVQVNAKNYTETQVKSAIISAGAGLGWIIKDVAPGKLLGEIELRGKHKATVDITYSKSTYSIVYVSSVGLESDGTTIHQNYNRWIANLEKAINANLINIQ